MRNTLLAFTLSIAAAVVHCKKRPENSQPPVEVKTDPQDINALKKSIYDAYANDPVFAGQSNISCANLEVNRITIVERQKNVVVAKFERPNSSPGSSSSCAEQTVVFSHIGGNWKELAKNGIGFHRLADINGDGFPDVIDFRNLGSDGDARTINAIYFGSADGNLENQENEAITQCGGGSDPYEYTKKNPQAKISKCEFAVMCTGGLKYDPYTLQYDCKKKSFLKMVQPDTPTNAPSNEPGKQE